MYICIYSKSSKFLPHNTLHKAHTQSAAVINVFMQHRIMLK